MAQSLFITAEEIAELLGSSKSYAYSLVKRLNAELQKNGYITICGKTNRQYFNEKIYGLSA